MVQEIKQKIIDNIFLVNVAVKGKNVVYFNQKFKNKGENHKLTGSFLVTPKGKTIKFFILTDSQFVSWTTEKSDLRPSIFTSHSKENMLDPEESLYSSKDAITEGKFEVNLNDKNSIYFILDNSHSMFTSKEVHVQVWEKWLQGEYSEFMKRKIVKAKEELESAEKNMLNKPEDVMNNLRSAIEIVIKEKYGFKKIKRMKDFLTDAKEYDLFLPSYSLIQSIYSEGNKRLHGGEINTRFEIEESLRIVKKFVEKLSNSKISSESVVQFKKKSNSVI